MTNDGRASKQAISCTCPPQGSTPRVGSAGIRHPIHFDRDIVPLKARQFLVGRDPDNPFFLAVAFRGPKDPWSDYPDDVSGLYAEVTTPMPATATEADAARQPPFLRASLAADRGLELAKNHEALAAELRNNYRLVSTIDGTVGRLRTLIAYDPRLPAATRGQMREELVLNIDLAPTILSWAGLSIPPAMQGRSLVPLVEDRSESWREDFYHEFTWTADGRIAPSEGIRSARWKYNRYFSQSPVVEQLFDLQADPGETVDVSAAEEHATLLDDMRRKVETYRAALSRP